MGGRQTAFPHPIESVLERDAPREPISLQLLYDAATDERPDLVDDEREPADRGGGLKWRHDLRWAVEQLVQDEPPRAVRLGNSMYMAPRAAHPAGDDSDWKLTPGD